MSESAPRSVVDGRTCITCQWWSFLLSHDAGGDAHWQSYCQKGWWSCSEDRVEQSDFRNLLQTAASCADHEETWR